MPNQQEVSNSTPLHRRHFQFSLRAMFIFSFLFAIFSAGIFSKYDIVRYLALLIHEMFWFYIVLAWAIYGRGYLRTFGIGASISFVFPWAVTGLFWIVGAFGAFDQSSTVFANAFQIKTWEDGLAYFWPCIVAFVIVFDAFFTGGLMVLARWMIDRSREKSQTETPKAEDVCGVEKPMQCEAASG
jgi:hypothetical protein